jgi:hypothetical protein
MVSDGGKFSLGDKADLEHTRPEIDVESPSDTDGRNISASRSLSNGNLIVPRRPQELKIAEWQGKTVTPWQSAAIFAFMRENPECALTVRDCRSANGEMGVVVVNCDGALAIKVGNNIYALRGALHANRFVWSDESAVKLGEFEFSRDLKESHLALIAQTRSFLRKWNESVRSDGGVEKQGKTFSLLLRTILARKRVGYIVYARGSEKRIESVYFKCSRREAQHLKELARKEHLDMYENNGDAEVLLSDDSCEADYVNLLKNVGYDLDYCMPAKVIIVKNGVQFYPPDL